MEVKIPKQDTVSQVRSKIRGSSKWSASSSGFRQTTLSSPVGETLFYTEHGQHFKCASDSTDTKASVKESSTGHVGRRGNSGRGSGRINSDLEGGGRKSHRGRGPNRPEIGKSEESFDNKSPHYNPTEVSIRTHRTEDSVQIKESIWDLVPATKPFAQVFNVFKILTPDGPEARTITTRVRVIENTKNSHSDSIKDSWVIIPDYSRWEKLKRQAKGKSGKGGHKKRSVTACVLVPCPGGMAAYQYDPLRAEQALAEYLQQAYMQSTSDNIAIHRRQPMFRLGMDCLKKLPNPCLAFIDHLPTLRRCMTCVDSLNVTDIIMPDKALLLIPTPLSLFILPESHTTQRTTPPMRAVSPERMIINYIISYLHETLQTNKTDRQSSSQQQQADRSVSLSNIDRYRLEAALRNLQHACASDIVQDLPIEHHVATFLCMQHQWLRCLPATYDLQALYVLLILQDNYRDLLNPTAAVLNTTTLPPPSPPLLSCWIDLPGGKRDVGESCLTTALREFHEETGLRLKTLIPTTAMEAPTPTMEKAAATTTEKSTYTISDTTSIEGRVCFQGVPDARAVRVNKKVRRRHWTIQTS